MKGIVGIEALQVGMSLFQCSQLIAQFTRFNLIDLGGFQSHQFKLGQGLKQLFRLVQVHRTDNKAPIGHGLDNPCMLELTQGLPDRRYRNLDFAGERSQIDGFAHF